MRYPIQWYKTQLQGYSIKHVVSFSTLRLTPSADLRDSDQPSISLWLWALAFGLWKHGHELLCTKLKQHFPKKYAPCLQSILPCVSNHNIFQLNPLSILTPSHFASEQGNKQKEPRHVQTTTRLLKTFYSYIHVHGQSSPKSLQLWLLFFLNLLLLLAFLSSP